MKKILWDGNKIPRKSERDIVVTGNILIWADDVPGWGGAGGASFGGRGGGGLPSPASRVVSYTPSACPRTSPHHNWELSSSWSYTSSDDDDGVMAKYCICLCCWFFFNQECCFLFSYVVAANFFLAKYHVVADVVEISLLLDIHADLSSVVFDILITFVASSALTLLLLLLLSMVLILWCSRTDYQYYYFWVATVSTSTSATDIILFANAALVAHAIFLVASPAVVANAVVSARGTNATAAFVSVPVIFPFLSGSLLVLYVCSNGHDDNPCCSDIILSSSLFSIISYSNCLHFFFSLTFTRSYLI